MPLNLIDENSNKFLFQAYLSSKIKPLVKKYLTESYPNLLDLLSSLSIFISFKPPNIIKILLTTEDIQLVSFLKTEINNLIEYLQQNIDSRFKEKEILVIIKNKI